MVALADGSARLTSFIEYVFILVPFVSIRHWEWNHQPITGDHVCHVDLNKQVEILLWGTAYASYAWLFFRNGPHAAKYSATGKAETVQLHLLESRISLTALFRIIKSRKRPTIPTPFDTLRLKYGISLLSEIRLLENLDVLFTCSLQVLTMILPGLRSVELRSHTGPIC